ncbi:unnamed protein product [Aphanomyces euteiches]|uniref:Nucleolar protein 6 n=1 Tax=Aphanomyces euteiches TaxID=100861 RepID=A0A6G0XSG2_9STRA|nr:hypothetical protein Ae201684_001902 [Aphanomyces euteiches]KAH9155797.1 hypothetical protein AeRB84_002264 [Aphanomyces euteiches]
MSKYALPTTDEMRQLHAVDQSSVFQSNFFKLQIDQLLEEVTVNYTAFASLNAVLFALKETIDAIPEQQVTTEALNMPGLVVRNHHKQVVLPFHPPTRLDVVGSYSLRHGTTLGQTLTIDVAIELPDACFVPKDFLNYRYHDKRNLYLGVLADELQQSATHWSSVSVTSFAGDTSKPILRLAMDKKIKQMQVFIHVIPVLSSSAFAASKLHPGKSNLRHEPPLDATPVYNNAVLEDMYVVSHFRALHATAAQSTSFVEACILLKVWLRQRTPSAARDSLSGFHASMLLLYLIQTGKISLTAPAETMFKVWLQFVATTDLPSNPLYFPTGDHPDAVVPTPTGLAAFQAAFDIVLLDMSGRLNLLSRVSRSAWAEIQWLAKQSSTILLKATAEAFRFVFIERHSIWTRYDEYIWLHLTPSTKKWTHQQLDAGGSLEHVLPAVVGELATKALGNRVHRVRPLVGDGSSGSEWPLTKAPPTLTKIALGLSLNPENAQRIVDKGPDADDVEAARNFRSFWKHRAELRRFKDGSIVESVIWDDVAPSQIVGHILQTGLPLHDQLDEILAGDITSSNQTWNDEEFNVASLLKAWSTLQSTLRDFDDTVLPLKVQDFQLIAPAMRRTSSFPPTPHPLAGGNAPQGAKFVSTTLDPYTVVLQFESSSSWPPTPDAVEKAKLGFYVQMAVALEKIATACQVHPNGVDVLLGGFPFRVVILTEREKSFPSKYYDLHYGALHATMIHAMTSKHSAFGRTVRLLMQWLDAHLASNVLPLQACELIVASVFLSPSPPQSVLSGFTRVLQLLANFDWKSQPLIVDLHENLSEDRRREMQKTFDASSSSPKTHPALFLFASYERDDHPSFWTRHVTEPVMSQRLVSLAKATATQWLHWLAHGAAPHGWQACFAHVMDYDVVFHLTTLGLGTVFPKSKSRFAVPYYKNLKQSDPFATLFIGLDPLEDAIKQLTARFQHLALFFVNRQVIAVRWKPPAFLPTRFRVLHATHQLPLSSDDDTVSSVPQVMDILREMKRMLYGLVERVELK